MSAFEARSRTQMTEVRYQLGFPDLMRPAAAQLYDEAFAEKLRPAIRNDAARFAVLTEGIDPSRGVAALDGNTMVGIAGFHDEGGSLTSRITFATVRRHIGLWRGLWAMTVFGFLDRRPKPDELLMDGIAVRTDSRGRGIGTGLLREIEAHGRSLGKSQIRLEVVDTNPNARRLYERFGFEPAKTFRLPVLGPIMGFTASTTMVKQLD